MSTSTADPSGSELSKAPVTPGPQRRRVKITPWRILNTAVLLILGTTKALSTFLGQTSVPNNLDWTLGVVWALISYWVSIIEQETPEVAPWFFTADFSRLVRLGFAGFCVTLIIGAFWAVVYGLMALTFGRLIHPPILHGLSVGFVGFIILILSGFAGFRLARFLPRLRKSWNKLRFPRFYDGLFHRSDWVPDIVELLLFSALIPTDSRLNISSSRSWYNIERDSEVVNTLIIGAGMIVAIIWSSILIFLMGVAGRMVSRWLAALGAVLRAIRLPRLFPIRWRSARDDGSSSQPPASALPLTHMSAPVPQAQAP
ncbi:hypothetical protein FB451DRAFT_1402326 [Mycena latifolia]|nr:hypothetical protein FB451DRAFT_1402326 [Mycena latifolia]